MKTIFLLCGMCCFLTVNSMAAVTLIKDGKALSEIIIGEKPTRTAQFAAFELQHALKMMTGVELKISARASDVHAVKIYVGDRKRAASCKGEEYSVQVGQNAIYLEGNDTLDFGKVQYANPSTFPRTSYYFRGTEYAVYDFLEKVCGIRYYSYGDQGISFKPCKTLTVKEYSCRRSPAMPAFRWIYLNSISSHRDRSLLEHRWRLVWLYGVCNHNIYSLYYRYWGKAKSPQLAKVFIEKRPDYFAHREQGRLNSTIAKTEYPGQYVPSQLCYSSEGPVNYFAWEADQVYRRKHVPGAKFGYLVQMQGMPFYYPIQPDDDTAVCQCKECLKKQNQNRTAYHFEWINRIAEAARKRNPEIKLVTLAYGVARERPKDLILDPGLGIQICMSLQSWFHPLVYKRQHGTYKDWMANEGKNRLMTVWLYLLDPAREAKVIHKYKQFFPVLYPEHTGKYFTEMVNDGVQGFSAEIRMEQHELEAWLLARLAFDPSVSYPDLLKEYFHVYYGHAGKTMQKVYDTLESISYNPANYPAAVMKRDFKGSYTYGIHTEKTNWSLGTPERMKHIRNLLNQALREADDASSKARVQSFIDRIWKQAETGRKEFEKRKYQRMIPIPVVSLPITGQEYSGDPDKINFAYAYRQKKWKTAYNKPVNVRTEMKVLADSSFLYLDFTEKDPYAFQHRNANMWTNGWEIFSAEKQDGSYLQIFVDVNGKAVVYQNKVINGILRFEKLNLQLKMRNELSSDCWHLRVAIPLSALGETDPKNEIYLNCMRVRNADTKFESYYYSPIFSGSHKDGLYRMGKFILPLKSKADAKPDIDGTFQAQKGKKWYWTAVPKQTTLKIENGTLMMTAAPKHDSPLYWNKIYPTAIGKKYVYEFTASGSGSLAPAFFLFNGNGNHYIAIFCQHQVHLTAVPRKYRYELAMPCKETYSYPPTHTRFGFLVWPGSKVKLQKFSLAER